MLCTDKIPNMSYGKSEAMYLSGWAPDSSGELRFKTWMIRFNPERQGAAESVAKEIMSVYLIHHSKKDEIASLVKDAIANPVNDADQNRSDI